MSFIFMALGVIAMFGSIIATMMVYMGAVDPTIYMVISAGIGVLSGLALLLITMTMGRIMTPIMKAKIGRRSLIATVTAGKNIELLVADDDEGILDTEKGGFVAPVDSIYMWPNNVKGGIAFYKYGITLKPKEIKAASILKKNGVNDINQVEAINEAIKKQGGEMTINLDEQLDNGDNNA